MKVVNRRGKAVPMCFSELSSRLREIIEHLHDDNTDVDVICLGVFNGMHKDMSTPSIDKLTMEECAKSGHGVIANVIAATDLHRCLYYWMGGESAAADASSSTLFNRPPPPYSVRVAHAWKRCNNVSDAFCKFVVDNSNQIDAIPDYTADLRVDHNRLRRTIQDRCLLTVGGAPVETVQDMYLRFATSVYMDFKKPEAAIAKIRETYELLSSEKVELSAVSLRNAGTRRENLVPRFAMELEDGVGPVFKGLADAAQIMMLGSSVTVNVSGVASMGRGISGSGITSTVRMIRDTAEWAGALGQGSSENSSTPEVLIDAWHADLLMFMKQAHRRESMRWTVMVPDLLIKAAEAGDRAPWYMFSPDTAPELLGVWGEAFDVKYAKAIENKTYVRAVGAADLLQRIRSAPAVRVIYKDKVAEKSAHRNTGAMRGGSCYCDPGAYTGTMTAAVRMDLLADDEDLKKLGRTLIGMLDSCLEVSCHPTKETYDAIQALRCIGVSARGMREVCKTSEIEYDSDAGVELCRSAAEALAHVCMEASMCLVRDQGLPEYRCFRSSPYFSGGISAADHPTAKLDWEELRHDIKIHKMRNSMLTIYEDLPMADDASDEERAWNTKRRDACAPYADQVVPV